MEQQQQKHPKQKGHHSHHGNHGHHAPQRRDNICTPYTDHISHQILLTSQLNNAVLFKLVP